METPQSILGASSPQRFTPKEREVVGGLTVIFAMRMLGFYLVLPVFAPYVSRLPGSTPLLVGLGIGIYGLTQALFQVPFGSWSDRIGRKPVIAVGLGLFALGSVICAMADNAPMLVLGRSVQGCGALASVAVAMIADLTRDAVRTRAMAMIGVAIGGTFTLGMLLGPPIAAKIGIPILFWVTAVLCVVGIIYLWLRIPEAPRITHHDDAEFSKEHVFEVVSNRQLLILDWGTFNLHVSLTCLFVAGPFLLEHFIGYHDYWKVFLPIFLVGFPIMLGGAQISGRPGLSKPIARVGKGILAMGLLVLALSVPGTVHDASTAFAPLLAGIALFIIGFALLEPLFPALLTNSCQQTNRGTAVGIFNMSQFSGAFVGGLLSGFFLETSLSAMFFILAGSSTIWIIVASKLDNPQHLTILGIPLLGRSREERRTAVRALLGLRGVEDVAWEKQKEHLLIRYDEKRIKQQEVRTALEEMQM